MTAEDILVLAGKLNSDGTLSGADLEGYINVILDALAVHIERDRIRKGLWKEYHAEDQVEVIRYKADRMRRSLEILAVDGEDEEAQKAAIIEECHDIINYATFTVRLLESK